MEEDKYKELKEAWAIFKWEIWTVQPFKTILKLAEKIVDWLEKRLKAPAGGRGGHMKIIYCPECGEKMRDESIGWRCPKCKGFVSFTDGKFYPHIESERPFVPPISNADRIRAMSDEELAAFLANPCQCNVDPGRDGPRECGNDLCLKYLRDWLQQPAEEVWNERII